jgi:CRISPR-associated protein Cas1
MLSYLYTLLYGNVSAAIQVVGFDPYRGFLHDDRNGHLALASDLMEEFRPLVDTLVLKLVNRGQIRETHFTKTEKGTWTLGKETSGLLIRTFQEFMAQRTGYRELTLNYYQILEQQARLLARHLFGLDTYQSFTRDS